MVAAAAIGIVALPAVAFAKTELVEHDAEAALKTYEALLAAVLSGDPEQLKPFVPIRIVMDKKVYGPDSFAEFQKLATHNGDVKDQPLAKLGSFTRTKWDHKGKPVYLAALDRHMWFEEQDASAVDGGVLPEGHHYGFEHWYVVFDGPRIEHYILSVAMF